MTYCIDTSTMIDAGERHYPEDVFPAFWKKMDGIVNAGNLRAPQTLVDELAQKSDAWRDWVYQRAPKMIEQLDAAVLAHMPAIMAQYASVSVKAQTGDPFFIAFAKERGLTLITSESQRKGGAKIPAICTELGVPTITLLGFIRKQGWRF